MKINIEKIKKRGYPKMYVVNGKWDLMYIDCESRILIRKHRVRAFLWDRLENEIYERNYPEYVKSIAKMIREGLIK